MRPDCVPDKAESIAAIAVALREAYVVLSKADVDGSGSAKQSVIWAMALLDAGVIDGIKPPPWSTQMKEDR